MIAKNHVGHFSRERFATTIYVVPCGHLIPIWVEVDQAVMPARKQPDEDWPEGFPFLGEGRVNYANVFANFGGTGGTGYYQLILQKKPRNPKPKAAEQVGAALKGVL